MHLPSLSTLLQLSISVASAMLDVILLVVCGVLLRRVSLLDRNTTRKMSALLFHIIAPSFQFLKCARAFSLDAMKLMWICPIMALVYLVLGHLLANVVFINQKGLKKRIPVMASTFTNFSTLPFVFVKSLIKSGVFRGETQEILEERAMGYISMFLAPNSIVMFSYGFLYLSLTSEELKGLFKVFSWSRKSHDDSLEDAVSAENGINTFKEGYDRLDSPSDDGDRVDVGESSPLIEEDADALSSYGVNEKPSTSRPRKHLHTLGKVLAFSYRRIITPPLIAIGIAFLLSLHPAVKKNVIIEPPLFVSSIIHTLETISGGFLALSMFVLGANLSTSMFSSPPSDSSSSPSGRHSIWQKCCPSFLWRFHTNIVKRYLFKFNSYSTLFLTIMVKMVILPIIAMVIVNLLVYYQVIDSDPVLILVLLIESATPCAFILVVLCNLAGDRGVEQMSEITFWMYVVSPFTLLIWTSIFLANGCAYAPDMCV